MPPVFSLVCIRILAPIPSAISSLCRSASLVFIMTRNELVEGSAERRKATRWLSTDEGRASDEYRIAGLAMKVWKELGFCMLESAYERALIWELNQAGYTAERQVPIIITYKGETLNHGYCADIVVDRKIILELKAVTRLYAIHRRQLQFYLSAGKIDSGLLINFGNSQRLECERMVRKDACRHSRLGVNPQGIFHPLTEEEKKNPSESFAERIARIVDMDEKAGGDA